MWLAHLFGDNLEMQRLSICYISLRWVSSRRCIAGALEAAGEKGLQVDVRAVGITNQRETVVVWDRATGRALHNAVVWLDTRTAPLCDRMAQELGGVVRSP